MWTILFFVFLFEILGFILKVALTIIVIPFWIIKEIIVTLIENHKNNK